MFLYLLNDKVRVLALSLGIIIRQFLLVFSATLNARALTALVNMDFSIFILQYFYLFICWAVIIFLDIKLTIYQEDLIQDLLISVKNDITNSISKLTFQEYHNKTSGTYISWLNNDIELINTKGYTQFFNIIHAISGAFFAVISLITYHWSLLIFTIFGAGLMLLVPKKFSKKIKDASLTTTIENSNYITSLEDILGGFDVYYSFNLLHRIPSRVFQASVHLKNAFLNQTKTEAQSYAAGFAINVILQIFITFFTGYLAFNGQVAIGAVEATSTLADIIFNSFSRLANQVTLLSSVNPIFDKFKTLVSTNSTFGESLISEDKSQPLYCASDLSFGYKDNNIFSSLSFTIYEGEKILILGGSGSGKSTLIKLMSGYLPNYKGSIRYHGLEINTVKNSIIKEKIMYIDQNPYLFAGTVKDNINLDQSYSENNIIRVLIQAGFTISEANKLINYPVEEKGKNLSGGQKQRVVLARGLIRNKNIILIDEGTSAVDKHTSVRIEESLLQNKDLTLFIVTHSPNKEIIIDKFDKVLSFPNDFK